MMNNLAAWFRRLRGGARANTAPASPASTHNPLLQGYDRRRYELADGSPDSPPVVARLVGYRDLPGGGLETDMVEMTPPEWISHRTREQTTAVGHYDYRRTHYYPWEQERRRVALSWDAAGQPSVDYHEYFPTGELRRHRRLSQGRLTTLYAFPEPEEGEEYTYIEQMPQFPGGMEQLMRDLGRFTKYPAAALRAEVQGKVPVHFLLGPDGVMRDFSAAPDAHPLLAEAALQALRQIARIRRWQPGMQNRRCVAVSYTVPVTFTIR